MRKVRVSRFIYFCFYFKKERSSFENAVREKSHDTNLITFSLTSKKISRFVRAGNVFLVLSRKYNIKYFVYVCVLHVLRCNRCTSTYTLTRLCV